MSNDPTDCREKALRCAERAAAARSPAFKAQLGLAARNLFMRSVELERLIVASERTASSPALHVRDHPEDRIESLRVLLSNADQQVAGSERIVSDWSTLVDSMQAEGRDVTLACDLLETFRRNLEAHRANRDLVHQTLQRVSRTCWSRSPGA